MCVKNVNKILKKGFPGKIRKSFYLLESNLTYMDFT